MRDIVVRGRRTRVWAKGPHDGPGACVVESAARREGSAAEAKGHAPVTRGLGLRSSAVFGAPLLLTLVAGCMTEGPPSRAELYPPIDMSDSVAYGAQTITTTDVLNCLVSPADAGYITGVSNFVGNAIQTATSTSAVADYAPGECYVVISGGNAALWDTSGNVQAGGACQPDAAFGNLCDKASFDVGLSLPAGTERVVITYKFFEWDYVPFEDPFLMSLVVNGSAVATTGSYNSCEFSNKSGSNLAIGNLRKVIFNIDPSYWGQTVALRFQAADRNDQVLDSGALIKSIEFNTSPYPCDFATCGGCADFATCAGTDVDGDTYNACVDCNDNNPNIYPTATEVCNGLDDNCSGVTDEGFPPNQCNDTDFDGLSDNLEALVGTDPNNPDSDGDGAEDGPEVGSDPNNPNDADGQGPIDALDPCVPDNSTCDPDGDGLTGNIEQQIGTDPLDNDSDGDGITDDVEVGDPGAPTDSDGDGIIDALESQTADADGDGTPDQDDAADSDPCAPSTGAGPCDQDNDGLTNDQEEAIGTNTTNPDSDGDGKSDSEEYGPNPFPYDVDQDGIIDALDSSIADTDGDGQVDESDPTNGDPCVPEVTSLSCDQDADGLTNGEEAAIGTNPTDADTDDDGVMDGQEQQPGGDADGDGLANALDADSDNDGLFDGTELGNDCNGPGTNQSAGNCIPDADDGATTTDPLDPDTDNSGVTDGSEDWNLNGQIDPGESNPSNPSDDSGIVDSDGDGLSDPFEISLGANPNDGDSDDDGVPDGQEVNPAWDSDNDGLPNTLDPDSDNDGLWDGTEMGLACNASGTDLSADTCIPDADAGATTTSPVDSDSDDGGAKDGAEDWNHNGILDAGEGDPTTGHPDDDVNIVDSDNDGLSDQEEMQFGSNPLDSDSDDDGLLDGQELNPTADSDGDGLKNAEDPDSDNDGLPDGLEQGFGCFVPGLANCVPDGDLGATTTSPVNADTDGGGVKDGIEDANGNGLVDPGEGDPNDPSDDQCTQNLDCAGNLVCDPTTSNCVEPLCDASTPCPDPDGCHLVGVCDPASGLCVYPNKPNGLPCPDDNTCTTDLCFQGACLHNNVLDGQLCGESGVCVAGHCLEDTPTNEGGGGAGQVGNGGGGAGQGGSGNNDGGSGTGNNGPGNGGNGGDGTGNNGAGNNGNNANAPNSIIGGGFCAASPGPSEGGSFWLIAGALALLSSSARRRRRNG